MASKKCSKKRRTKQYRPSGREFFCNPVGAALLKVSRINNQDLGRYFDLSHRAIDLLAIDMCPLSEFDELTTQAGVATMLVHLGVCSDAVSSSVIEDGLHAISDVAHRISEKAQPTALPKQLERITALIERHQIQLMYACAADVNQARKDYMDSRNGFWQSVCDSRAKILAEQAKEETSEECL